MRAHQTTPSCFRACSCSASSPSSSLYTVALSEPRRFPACFTTCVRPGNLGTTPCRRDGPEVVVVDRDHVATREIVRIVHDVRDVVDRPVDGTGGGEVGDQLGIGAQRRPGFEVAVAGGEENMHLLHRFLHDASVDLGAEFGGAGPRHDAADRLPADGSRTVRQPVLRLVDVAQHAVFAQVIAGALCAVLVVACDLGGDDAEQALEQRDVDDLDTARLLARAAEQGGKYAHDARTPRTLRRRVSSTGTQEGGRGTR